MRYESDAVSIRTVELERDQLLVIQGGRWKRLKVIYGGLWLTSEGDLQDRLPRAGESVVLEERGRSVAQAFGFTRVELTESIRRRPLQRVAETFRRALPTFRSGASAGI